MDSDKNPNSSPSETILNGQAMEAPEQISVAQQPPTAAEQGSAGTNASTGGEEGRGQAMQTLIPTKNKNALMSYYFGVFGLIPFLGLFLSVAAIVFGVLGLRQYKQAPTPGAKVHALVGLGLGIFELLVFVILVIFTIVTSISYSN